MENKDLESENTKQLTEDEKDFKRRKIRKQCKFKNKSFLCSLPYALNGLKEIFLSEKNIRIQLATALVVLLASIILKITLTEGLVLFITIFFVIFSEIVNTMVEKILDLYTLEYNEEVKIIKDMAAGGVLFSVASSIVIGAVVFVPKLIQLILY